MKHLIRGALIGITLSLIYPAWVILNDPAHPSFTPGTLYTNDGEAYSYDTGNYGNDYSVDGAHR